MVCCLNPECDNPQLPDNTQSCSQCGIPLVKLDDRYLPLKCLGQGGFGKTYLAKDTKKLDELCVIKQFVPQVGGIAILKWMMYSIPREKHLDAKGIKYPDSKKKGGKKVFFECTSPKRKTL